MTQIRETGGYSTNLTSRYPPGGSPSPSELTLFSVEAIAAERVSGLRGLVLSPFATQTETETGLIEIMKCYY